MSPAAKRGPPLSVLSKLSWRFSLASDRPERTLPRDRVMPKINGVRLRFPHKSGLPLSRESIDLQDENMKKSDANQGQSASELISKRIVELGDWRGKTLSR